ncbi:hypothetical protein EGW08_013073 [Elysia chlorotica]|uniref:Uncharacterized protein n=1 Tax=Elysia chlorotica TaxID=188477 RepID=A0A433TC41_ELYCH|nr:hypothetical protein EGW08_013073 [Elysia chlorotica]
MCSHATESQILYESESLARIAVQVALPPTSSDDEEDDKAEEQKVQPKHCYFSTEGNSKSPEGQPNQDKAIYSKDIHSGKKTTMFADRIVKCSGNEESNRDSDYVFKEKLRSPNASLPDLFKLAEEKETSHFDDNSQAKIKESSHFRSPIGHGISCDKPSPHTYSCLKARSPRTTLAKDVCDNTRSENPRKESTCETRCHRFKSTTQCLSLPVAVKVETLNSKSKSCPSSENNKLVSEAPRRVKIEKRSLAFQDLLKKF